MRRCTVGALATGVVGVVGLLACAEQRAATRPATAAARIGDDFDARLRKIARDYRDWPRVSDLAQWAPALCRAPGMQPGIRMSESEEFTGHGRKLYYVHAQDQTAYARLAWGESDGTAVTSSPVGQAVVKETWFAEPVEGAMVPFAGYGVERRANDGAAGPNGREYRAGAKGDLFIIFKVDPLTPGTDDGWVYGTVTTGGLVTSAGRVQSCMNCHTQAPNERLFGAR